MAEGDHVGARELIDEAIEAWSVDAHETGHLVRCYERLGEVLRLEGNHRRALAVFAESIRIARLRGEQSPHALEGIAAVWAALGDSERAVRIAGATERIRERLGVARAHADRALPERLDPAWSEGRAMSTEEAVEYALRDIE